MIMDPRVRPEGDKIVCGGAAAWQALAPVAGHHGSEPGRYASTTSVSTEEMSGRCWAMQVQLSPSSALANSVPVLVPK